MDFKFYMYKIFQGKIFSTKKNFYIQKAINETNQALDISNLLYKF